MAAFLKANHTHLARCVISKVECLRANASIALPNALFVLGFPQLGISQSGIECNNLWGACLCKPHHKPLNYILPHMIEIICCSWLMFLSSSSVCFIIELAHGWWRPWVWFLICLIIKSLGLWIHLVIKSLGLYSISQPMNIHEIV